MNLTPEEQAIGKENFQAIIGSRHVRRDFLLKGIKANVASGRGLGPMYFGYDTSIASPVRVGVIGTGDEGSVLIGAINPDFLQVKSIADIRPYNVFRAFCGDLYSKTAQRVRPGLIKKYGFSSEAAARKSIRVYGPYQELIDNAKADGIEAVIIALPLHLHAPAAIAALKAGLHVLTEKLMGHSIVECKEMARAAKQAQRHLATGHQRHYNILYDNAVELIRRGGLGELHYIRAQWHRGNLPGTDSWRQAMPEAIKPGDDKAKDLEQQLGKWRESLKNREEKLSKTKDENARRKLEKEISDVKALMRQKKAQIEDKVLKDTAQDYGYQDRQIKDGSGQVVYGRPAAEELIRWRLWDRTGGGLMAELGSHQLDAASIFVAAVHGGKKQYPLSVAAAANRPLFPPDRDVDDHVYCLFEFPAPGYHPESAIDSRKKIGVQYASINGNGFGGYGETVLGTQGTLLLERETEAMLWQTHSVESRIKADAKRNPETKQVEVQLTIDEKGDARSRAIGDLGTQVAERGYAEQIEHWAWCIRNNPECLDLKLQPRCHPRVALGDAVIALTTNMAARRGLRVEFDKRWFDPASDATPERDVLKKDVQPDLSRYA